MDEALQAESHARLLLLRGYSGLKINNDHKE